MISVFSTLLTGDCPRHSHDCHELIVGVSGNAYLHVDDQRYSISSQCTILVRAGVAHHYALASNKGGAKIFFICFDDASVQMSLARALKGGVSSAMVDDECVNENTVLVRKLERVLKERRGYHRDIAGNLLNLMLLSHINMHNYPRNTSLNRQEEKIKAVAQWVRKNLTEDIGIDEAAKRALMSRTTFTRCFRQYTEMSFVEYLSNARIDRAVNLLSQESLSVTEVSYQSGYKTPGHFYKQFQARYGMTPSSYRKMAVAMTLGSMPKNLNE